jgi:hypothetical protein
MQRASVTSTDVSISFPHEPPPTPPHRRSRNPLLSGPTNNSVRNPHICLAKRGMPQQGIVFEGPFMGLSAQR